MPSLSITIEQLANLLDSLETTDCGCDPVWAVEIELYPDTFKVRRRKRHLLPCRHVLAACALAGNGQELTVQHWAAMCCHLSRLVFQQSGKLEENEDYIDRPLPTILQQQTTRTTREAVLTQRASDGLSLFHPQEHLNLHLVITADLPEERMS